MICLELPLPPGKNVTRQATLSKTGKIYMVGGEDAAKYKMIVQFAVNRRHELHPIVPFAKRAKIRIEVWFTFPTWQHDSDGPYSLLKDSLARALKFNDLYVIHDGINKKVRRGERRCYVEVSEVTE